MLASDHTLEMGEEGTVPEKPKLSVYWAAACGGCEVSVVNIHEKILDVDANFDFMFCPCLLDTKKKEIEALDDGAILLTLFNGAIRTEENEEMAHLMRKKSKLLVAFGSCANEGCIPALSNLSTRNEHLRAIYLDNPSVDNPGRVLPKTNTTVPEGSLHLPRFYDQVRTLSQVVDVDYFMPGCPPEAHQIAAVIDVVIAVLQGKAELPPKGSILGAGHSAVCDECQRKRTDDRKLTKFHRTWEIIPDRELCLLEQGVVCMGVATRDGCGALCPKVNMPCIGCYGAPDGVLDQGAKMSAVLGGLIDIEGLKGIPEEQIPARIDAMLDAIPDFAGTFYKFSVAGSALRKTTRESHEDDLD